MASSDFRVGARGRATSLSSPSLLSPSLISHLASVDVKQNNYLLETMLAFVTVSVMLATQLSNLLLFSVSSSNCTW